MMVLATVLMLSWYPLHKDTNNIVQAALLRGNAVNESTTLWAEEGRPQDSPHILQSDDGTIMLLDSERTLWTAGWNARHTRYYEGLVPAISWTVDAEDIFKKEYRRLHFPPNCAEVKGYVNCLAL